jgi:mono/diheme cytochrome c family protein
LRFYTLLALGLAACSAEAGMDDVAMGELVYREPLADGNTFTCATCHALEEPAADGLTRPGHAIGDATRRPSFKNGELDEFRDAVNSCVTEWMNGDPWSASDPRLSSLHAFLDAQAPAGEAPAVSFEIVAPPADLAGGDAASGREIFNRSCVVCHGTDATGTDRAPALVGSALTAEYVAGRVRTSGRPDSGTYDGLTGGIMPFFSADRLGDEELLDVVAYVVERSAEVTVADGGTDGGTDAGTDAMADAGPSGCEATHPRVGQTATLSMDFHRTTGTARIVDDCTIVIEDFGYDGTGIDVRFYGALGRDYDAGFPISEDLLRSGGYSGETLTLTLPEGRTLDDMDSISLWCVDVGVSFGDGVFAP